MNNEKPPAWFIAKRKPTKRVHGHGEQKSTNGKRRRKKAKTESPTEKELVALLQEQDKKERVETIIKPYHTQFCNSEQLQENLQKWEELPEAETNPATGNVMPHLGNWQKMGKGIIPESDLEQITEIFSEGARLGPPIYRSSFWPEKHPETVKAENEKVVSAETLRSTAPEPYLFKEEKGAETLPPDLELGDPRLDGCKSIPEYVRKRTFAEAAKGWLMGPFNFAEATVRGMTVAAKRFGVLQGPKIRTIDDLRHWNHNIAVTHKLELPSTRTIGPGQG